MLKRKKEHLDCENSHYFAQNLLMHTGTCSNGAYTYRKKVILSKKQKAQFREECLIQKKKSDSFDILGMDRVCL